MAQSITIDAGKSQFEAVIKKGRKSVGQGTESDLDISFSEDVISRLRNTKVFLVIGTGNGLVPLYVAANSNAKIVLAEPDKAAMECLEQSVKLNKWQSRFSWLTLPEQDNGAVDITAYSDKYENVGILQFDADNQSLALFKQLITHVQQHEPIVYVICTSEQVLSEFTAVLAEFGYEYAQTFGVSMAHLFRKKSEHKVGANQKTIDTVTTELKNKLDDANFKYRQAGTDIASLKSKLDEANTKYRNASENISTLKGQLENAKTAHLKATKELTSTQEKYHKLNEQLTASKHAEAELKQQLNEQLTASKHTETEIKQQLDQANLKYRSAGDNIKALKVKLEKQTAELSAKQLQQVQWVEQCEALSAELTELLAKQAQFESSELLLQQSLAEKEILLQESQQQCQQLSSELAQLKAELKNKEACYNRLINANQQEAEAAQQQIELLTELQQVKQRSICLNPLYQQLEHTKTILQTENAQLLQQNSSLNNALQEEQKRRQQVDKSLVTAQKRQASAEARLDEAQQAKAKLLQEAIATRSELDVIYANAKPAADVFRVATNLPTALATVANEHANYQQCIANLAALKIACIMDEFTFGSYAPEANLLQLTPQHWQRELDAFEPQLLFIESAWRGKHEIWGNKVGHKCQELVDIVNWCKQRNIPTVFWNKEDPVHFETFISTAKLFDQVFTTDIDCIHRYKAALEHERVYLLPFAAQPSVNNPIEKYTRKNAFCFAGAYYVRYPDRTRDLESFIQALPAYRPLEIYDRNYGKNDENYQFPPEYQQFIVGNLPFEQIDKAYKGYQYAINLNSIKHSQTMFARRVYELLASNTLTLSNYARGVKLLFGDLVACSDSGEQLLNWLYHTELNEHSADSVRLLALRSVMQYHTYQDRLAYVVNKVGLLNQSAILPCVTIMAYAATQQRYDRIVTQFNQQHYQHKWLVLATGAEVSQKVNQANIINQNIAEFKNLQASELVGSNGWLGFMVAEDEYAPDYLTDMALATRYAPGKAVGKGSHWRYSEQGELGLNYPGRRYHIGVELEARHALVQASVLSNADLYQQLRNVHKLRFSAEDNLAIDPMNYCKAGALCNKPAMLEAIVCQYDRSPAADYISLQRFAECITVDKEDATVFNATELHAQLQSALAKSNKAKAVLSNNTLQLRSVLADKKHGYWYLQPYYPVSQLITAPHTTAIQFSLQGKATGLDAKVVLQWLNSNDEVIEQHFADLNQSQQCAIPTNTEAVKLGLRLSGPGAVTIDHLTLQPLEQLASSAIPALEAEPLRALFKTPKKSEVSLSLANQVLDVVSQLADGKHEYYYAAKPIPLTDIPVTTNNQLNFHLETTPGLNLQLLIGFLDDKKQKISHDIRYANKNHNLDVPADTAYVQLALRFYAGGACAIKRLLWGHLVQQPQQLLPQSDVLLLTNHYPSYQDLYRNGFVHSRVKAYREQDVKVDVFRLRQDEPISWHEYQGVEVITGSQYALRQMLQTGAYRHVLVHFLDASMWEVLKDFIATVKVTVWVHGAEIQPWWRREYNYQSEAQLEAAKATSDIRLDFWQQLLLNAHANLHLVFVSKYFAEEVMEDVNIQLDENTYSIVHNPVDTELFDYHTKDTSQRLKFLSIRPYASRKYANDLSVKAVLELSLLPEFKDMEFLFMGDGVLFDETLAPLRVFENVKIEQRFLPQTDIAKLHKEFGMFLCPTRMDAQGVSKDEAMSSGLIVVSNAVTAIPEFVDHESGILAAAEDYKGMAEGIIKVVRDEHRFSQLSAAAASRARVQVAKSKIVIEELALFNKRGLIC